MSKTGLDAPNRGRTRGTGFFIPGKICGDRLRLPADAAEAPKAGGAYRDRTDDLKLAKLALSQLS